MTRNIAIIGLLVSLLLVAAAVAGIHGVSINLYDYDAAEIDVGF